MRTYVIKHSKQQDTFTVVMLVLYLLLFRI